MKLVGLFFAGVLLFLTAWFTVRWFATDSQINWQDRLSVPVGESGPTPTSTDFQTGMTIPELRNRNYQSALSELELLGSHTAFTSYLTHYDSDDLQINAMITRPTGEMPAGGWPAVVFVHGYIPPALYQTTERYVGYVNYLASRGLVVFKIDLRGHGDSEGEASGAYYAGDYIVDVLNAKAALAGLDFVAADKIGLWGHSMAGNVVLRSLAVDPTIKAAVIWAGAVYTYADWQQYGLNDNSYRPPGMSTQRQNRRQALFDTYGQFDPQHPFWQQVPATNYLDDFTSAIQIHHAVNDTVVNIEYSRGLSALLEQHGVTHEFYEYPSGGHDIEGASFNQAMQRSADWFSRYLTQ